MAGKQKTMTREELLIAAQKILPNDAKTLSQIRALLQNSSNEKPTPPSEQKKKPKTQQNSNAKPPAEVTNVGKKTKRALLIQQYQLIKQLPSVQDRIRAYTLIGIKVLVIVRGCPGSGKSTMAKSLIQPCGIKKADQHLFSSDDFFNKEPKQLVNLELLNQAKDWNELRVHLVMKKQTTPVIVDDCFITKMSLKTLYGYAIKLGYIVEIIEPQVAWAKNVSELIKHTHIPVTFESLSQIVNSYELVAPEHIINYFKFQYHPGQDPPQKGVNPECVSIESSKENLSAPKANKAPSPPGAKQNKGGEGTTNFNDVLKRLKNLKVQNEQDNSDHVLLGQNSASAKFKNMENEMVSVGFSKDSVLELQNLFGGYLAPNMLDKKIMISMPYGLARQLHCYVMESVEEDMNQKEQALAKGIEADLQDREDAKNGLKGKFNVSDLMEEEFEKFIKAVKNGSNPSKLSAKLPLKVLYERFPDADSDLIGKILSNTDSCLRKATSLVTSLPDPDTLVFKDPLEVVEISEVDRREAIDQALVYQKVSSSFFDEMNVYNEKAKTAYKEGNRTVANFYFEMAKWHKERIEKANVLAAMSLIRGKEHSDTLDLHFLSVKEATQILDLFIDAKVRSLNNSGEKSVFLYVITGRGAHSNYGNAALKHTAKKRLATRDLQYWEMNPGMLKICVKSTCPLSCDL